MTLAQLLIKTIFKPIKIIIDIICKKQVLFKTFTYYVPEPPSRNSSYREKNLDYVCADFLNKGFEIITVKTVAHTSPEQSGFWVIFVLKALTSEAEKIDINYEPERMKLESTELEIDYD